VEQNNNVAKGLFFWSSNKWDDTTDILINEHRLHQLRSNERTKQKYMYVRQLSWYLILLIDCFNHIGNVMTLIEKVVVSRNQERRGLVLANNDIYK